MTQRRIKRNLLSVDTGEVVLSFERVYRETETPNWDEIRLKYEPRVLNEETQEIEILNTLQWAANAEVIEEDRE